MGVLSSTIRGPSFGGTVSIVAHRRCDRGVHVRNRDCPTSWAVLATSAVRCDEAFDGFNCSFRIDQQFPPLGDLVPFHLLRRFTRGPHTRTWLCLQAVTVIGGQ